MRKYQLLLSIIDIIISDVDSLPDKEIIELLDKLKIKIDNFISSVD